jgi:cell division protein FtsI (penicillin-binding protein 3)
MAAAPTGRRRPAGRRGGSLVGSPKPARGGTDGRIRLLRFIFIVFLVLVGGKAVALASSSQHLTHLARLQQTRVVELPAPRGSILDRNGAELAVGKPAQTVFADPHLLVDPRAAAGELCDALQINRRKERRAVERALVTGKQEKSWFAYVKRQADAELAKAALALDIPGVGSYAEEERTYPMKATAAQVVGFAGVENKGLAGIELLYDKVLSGKPGSETVVQDPAGHSLKTTDPVEPVAGEDVRLTLDSQIQSYAENVLKRTVRDSGGKSAVSIVMDPRTGEILAMANVTQDGFHGFGKDPTGAADRNRAVTDVYEPGSIFKLVTISGALADGTVTPDTRFTLPPSIHVADREVHDAEARGTVDYSVTEILQHSSNVGAVTIGKMMHEAGMYKWLRAYGFGKPTGIAFPGESGGIVLPLDQWSGSSIGNIPMGQGVAVTAIQMASAFSTVADNGWQVKPRLIAQVGTKAYDTVERHRVIPGKVARQVRKMLQLAVESGTGTAAQIPGYDVAGKTGTAEIPLSDGSGYAKGIYVASFIGMVPADHPRLVVLCAVNGTPMFGGEAAAPAVKEIMQYSLQRLEIAP